MKSLVRQNAMLIATALAFSSMLIGVFLPALSPSALVNIPFDTAFGLGFLPLMITRGEVAAPLLGLLGYMIWPPVLAVLIGLGTYRAATHARRRHLIVAGIIICGLIVIDVPAKSWRASRLVWWPSFTKSASVIW